MCEALNEGSILGMCVCMYVSVTLRNVNLHSRSGTQVSLIHALHEDIGTTLAMEDGEDSTPGPSQCTYLVESSAEMSAECSRWLATLR